VERVNQGAQAVIGNLQAMISFKSALQMEVWFWRSVRRQSSFARTAFHIATPA
jgi:hypothetical protein